MFTVFFSDRAIEERNELRRKRATSRVSEGTTQGRVTVIRDKAGQTRDNAASLLGAVAGQVAAVKGLASIQGARRIIHLEIVFGG